MASAAAQRHPIVCPGGHVGERGEAGEGTRRGLRGERRPRQMLGSGRAQSSQPCPPRPSGVPSQEQRGRGATVPSRAVPGELWPARALLSGSGEVLGQDAVCWVRVRLSCSPDHFLPHLGNLDFLLPFVPYFSPVKLSLVLLETAAGAGPGQRVGGSGCFSSLAAHNPAAGLALPKWHPAVRSPGW